MLTLCPLFLFLLSLSVVGLSLYLPLTRALSGSPVSAACCHCPSVSFDTAISSLLLGNFLGFPKTTWFYLPFNGDPSSSSSCPLSLSPPPVNSVGTQSSVLDPFPSLGHSIQSWAFQEIYVSTTRIFTPLHYNLLQTPDLNLTMGMVSPLKCLVDRQNSAGFIWVIGTPHLYPLHGCAYSTVEVIQS